MRSSKELTNEQKHYLAMWLTTLFQTPPILNIVKELQTEKILSKSRMNFSIVEVYKYLRSKQKIQDEIRYFIISGLLDCGMISSEKDINLNHCQSRSTRKVLNKIIKQLEIQFHKEKLIYARKLTGIHPFKLFQQLDQSQIGYLTIKKLKQYVLQYFPNQQLPFEDSPWLRNKFITNIHHGNYMQTYKHTGNPLLNRIYLENFTELIQRICFYETIEKIGTFQYLKGVIEYFLNEERNKQVLQDYQHIKKVRSTNNLQLYRAEANQISILAQYLANLNKEQSQQSARLQQSQEQRYTRNTEVLPQYNLKKGEYMETIPTKLINNKKCKVHFQTQKKIKKASKHDFFSQNSNLRNQKSDHSVRQHTGQQFTQHKARNGQRSIYQTRKHEVEEISPARGQTKVKSRQIIAQNTYKTPRDNPKTDQYASQNIETSTNQPKPFIIRSQQHEILQKHQRDLQELLQLSRQERFRNQYLVGEVHEKANHLSALSISGSPFSNYKNSVQNQQNGQRSLSKLTTIKKDNTLDKKGSEIRPETPLFSSSNNNKPTHRNQPTFGDDLRSQFVNQNHKLQILNQQRDKLIRKQLEEIKMERIRNQVNMYMYC